MVLSRQNKESVIAKHKKHATDVGSSPVQIALLTERINDIVGHLKSNKKDQHSRRGLLVLVGKRKRLLKYLERSDTKAYSTVTKQLGL